MASTPNPGLTWILSTTGVRHLGRLSGIPANRDSLVRNACLSASRRWRLDHGAVHEASPKTIVLMIGVNNSNGVHYNGVPISAAVEGIRLCVANLRQRCPHSQIVLVKILLAFDPAKEVGAKVREMNTGVDALKLESDPKVRVLDLWAEFTNTDGTIKPELYSDGDLHLGPAGYERFASKLKPMLDSL